MAVIFLPTAALLRILTATTGRGKV